jgi:hypothetical protein
MIEARTTEGCSTISLQVVGVHGGVYHYLLELVDVLARNGLYRADVEPRRLQEVPPRRPAAGDHVVALLGPEALLHVVDAEVPFEAGL